MIKAELLRLQEQILRLGRGRGVLDTHRIPLWKMAQQLGDMAEEYSEPEPVHTAHVQPSESQAGIEFSIPAGDR